MRPLQIVERKFFDNWNGFEDNKLRMELEMQPLVDDTEVDFDTPAGAKGSGFLPRVSSPCLLQRLGHDVTHSRLAGTKGSSDLTLCQIAKLKVCVVTLRLASAKSSCMLRRASSLCML